MDINQKLTEELEVKRWQVDAAVKLIDEGNTIPFISRYRKEVTGSRGSVPPVSSKAKNKSYDRQRKRSGASGSGYHTAAAEATA